MNYYVYVYLNKLKPGKYQYDNLYFEYEPFYVGKGKKDRHLFHLNKVKNDCKYKDSIKFRIIKENISNGVEPIIIKIEEYLTEDKSLFLEKEVITRIGRLDMNTGPLTNRNDGSIKPQDNYRHDSESKSKISKSSKNRDPEKRYTLISPNGDIYNDIKLNSFCEKYKLDYQKIRKSSNKGKIKPIKSNSIKQSKLETINCVGWQVINKKIVKEITDKLKYKFIKPDGEEILIYSSDVIKEKCIEFKLDQRTLRYYKNKGVINIKNSTQSSEETINCQGWQFIDLELLHQGL